jgi:hypothetical protein
MNYQNIVVPVLAVVLLAGAWQAGSWAGVALVVTGLVMWVLLHITRFVRVLTRAADRPVGYIDSAVMFNAGLKSGVPLLRVLAVTRSLGECLSPENEQPEVYRWTDGGDSHVTCEFKDGKLVRWKLSRPEVSNESASSAAP